MTWLFLVTHVSVVIFLWAIILLLRKRVYREFLGRALLTVLASDLALSFGSVSRRHGWEYQDEALALGWTLLIAGTIATILAPKDGLEEAGEATERQGKERHE